MKLIYLSLLPLFCLSVIAMPPRETSPNDDSTSRAETPTQKSTNELSPAEQIAQAASGQLADSMGQYRFRSIAETDRIMESIVITNENNPPNGPDTGITRSSDGKKYTLWVGRSEVTGSWSAAHGIHQFQIGNNGRDTDEFDSLFAWGSEHYAAEVAIEGLGSNRLYLKQQGFNVISAHLEKIMQDSRKDSDELGSIVSWRLSFGDRRQIARDLNELTQMPSKPISPRHVHDLITHSEAQALAHLAARRSRRDIERRSIIDQINNDVSSNQIDAAKKIEDMLTYFYALQAKAITAIMPFINSLLSSNNFYLESLALPLFGMVYPSALISSPFGPGPLAPAGFDSFDGIQSALKTSGKYSASQLDYTASTHQFMRVAFRSMWKNASEVVNATGSLLEMRNIIIYLAVMDMKNPNATDLFPASYNTLQTSGNVASTLNRLNSTSTPRRA